MWRILLSDNTPTYREVLDGDAPYPTKAFHNNEGMYVTPNEEGTVGSSDMVQDKQTGLFLPAPTQKRVTRLFFDGGLTLEVSEGYDEVCETLRELSTGDDVIFTGPVYEEVVRITAHALSKLMALSIEYRDLAEIELAQRQRDLNMRMAEAQMTQQQTQLLGLTSRRNNRRN